MTNEQINRLVAEELGWKFESLFDPRDEPPIWKEIETEAWKSVPDFCNDHNAVAEMRQEIKKDHEQVRFVQCLCDLTFQGHEDIMPEYYWALINATPRQQAEAFLRMRGKWREG